VAGEQLCGRSVPTINRFCDIARAHASENESRSKRVTRTRRVPNVGERRRQGGHHKIAHAVRDCFLCTCLDDPEIDAGESSVSIDSQNGALVLVSQHDLGSQIDKHFAEMVDADVINDRHRGRIDAHSRSCPLHAADSSSGCG
jgi:hypothetical protein